VIILGIDIGLTGALAIVDEHRVVFVDDIPIFVIKHGKTTKKELDLGGLRGVMAAHSYDHVFIEEVGTRPGEGRVSAHTFGKTAGRIEGLVVGLGRPYSMVRPQVWQRTVRCGPSPDEARKRAGQLYPDAVPHLVRKKDDGRADAILIARTGLLLLGQNGNLVAAA
jgi:crossover junction endodeoxyribonuclease RuvC